MAEIVTPESRHIEAALQGDEEAFRQLVEPLSRELHVFCYRMLGSFHDAEDVQQDALLKAWRRLETYDGRASFRAWIYRIATNACLDALRTRRRRLLPQDLVGPADPSTPLGEQRLDITWLEPYPDALLPSSNPDAVVELRESIRLAFIRALQLLPPRQRAVLILRDVLDWPASDVAKMLDTTVPAVKSALQRARLMAARPEAARPDDVALEAQQADIASRYVLAWEAGDIDAIVSMLTEDAIQSMPPWLDWIAGREALRTAYSRKYDWGGEPRPGVFRMIPTRLNGQLGIAEYWRPGSQNTFTPLALTVVTPNRDGTLIAEKTSFVRPELFEKFGHPLSVEI